MAEAKWVENVGLKGIARFAESDEVNVARIRPVIIPITGAASADANLFRLTTLLWSVPVSRGYGRRMRFLVLDANNGKLMGVFALGDPVFNLGVRDQWIGWTTADRRQRASSVMDLFVCGAVPPYSSLLCGKLVAALATSQEVVDIFRQRYVGRPGIISNVVKDADLLLITTTSALGRSSMYNRLVLPTAPPTRFERIGHTEGWGHFAVSDSLFRDVRAYLARRDHLYADGHQFGTGPNWRLRTIRAAIEMLGLDGDLLRHGIQREVFACEMSEHTRQQLTSGVKGGSVNRPGALEISAAAAQRWMLPRFQRSGLPPCTHDSILRRLSPDFD